MVHRGHNAKMKLRSYRMLQEMLMSCRGLSGLSLSAALWWAVMAVLSASAETYPEFESQWRSAAADREAWDPSRPSGSAQQAPLTPEYQAIFEASLRDQAAGGRGNNYRSSCVLDGMPRLMSLVAPMEILIQPALTFFIFQNAFARRIHTDGAAMPAGEPPSYQGYSTGKWVDEDRDDRFDVLEIETRNFKGPRALEATGLLLHQDNQTLVKERLFLDRNNKDILRNEITTIDSAFTRPWTVGKIYQRVPNPRWSEYHCQPPPNAVFIGLDEYRLDPEGRLLPLYGSQPPPDMRYFKPQQAR
jgi:hypothetical protein